MEDPMRLSFTRLIAVSIAKRRVKGLCLSSLPRCTTSSLLVVCVLVMSSRDLSAPRHHVLDRPRGRGFAQVAGHDRRAVLGLPDYVLRGAAHHGPLRTRHAGW